MKKQSIWIKFDEMFRQFMSNPSIETSKMFLEKIRYLVIQIYIEIATELMTANMEKCLKYIYQNHAINMFEKEVYRKGEQQ